jgi:hypothetical protein
MHRAWDRARSVAAVTLLIAACRAPAAPFERDDDLTPIPNALSITLTKAIWMWDEVAAPQGSGVRATLTNMAERPLLSTLGDKFNSATEQANLFVAKGGSATLEWRGPTGEWRATALAQLVEGVKQILLRRGGNYTLTALLFGPRRTGLYRIRVDFFDAPAGVVRYTDYSAPFEIR